MDSANGDVIVINGDINRVDWVQAKADLANDDFDNGRSSAALERSFKAVLQHIAFAWLDHRLIGMARMLSDGVCNAYLLDVWTASALRRRGVGSRLVAYLRNQVPGQHIGLQTDERAFYSSLGFHEQPQFMSLVVGKWLDNEANR